MSFALLPSQLLQLYVISEANERLKIRRLECSKAVAQNAVLRLAPGYPPTSCVVGWRRLATRYDLSLISQHSSPTGTHNQDPAAYQRPNHIRPSTTVPLVHYIKGPRQDAHLTISGRFWEVP